MWNTLKGFQNHCLRYARRAVNSTCISNNELRSRCNIVSVGQRILALADILWKKASKNNDDIINFTYHHQSNSKTKMPLNIIKGNISSSNPCTLFICFAISIYIPISSTILQTQILRQHFLLSPAILLN